MVYKYPICDVFHWFCKIARFFATEPVRKYWQRPLLEALGFNPVYTPKHREISENLKSNFSHKGWKEETDIPSLP